MNLGYLFTLTLTFILPLALAGTLLYTKSTLRKPFFLGVLTFTVFQLLTRIPLLTVLSTESWFIAFSMKSPLGYLVVLSFTAALFEEGGRYLVFKKWAPHFSKKDILFFGLGHGGIEAFASYGGIERISAILLHVALSFWVYQSIRSSSKGGLIVALSLHTSFNVFALVLLQFNAAVWLVELMLFGLALFVFIHQWTLKENA